MSSKPTPHWFRQVAYQKEKRIITNGLTIPYLIGSYYVCFAKLPEDPIEFLMLEITNGEIDKCAVIQKCPYIQQYIVGFDDRQFCETYMKNEIQFKNLNGITNLVVTQNAKELGNDMKGLISRFGRLYLPFISKYEFSWNNTTRTWGKFNEVEIELIKNGK